MIKWSRIVTKAPQTNKCDRNEVKAENRYLTASERIAGSVEAFNHLNRMR